MNNPAYVLVNQLCTHYAIEQSFFYSLRDQKVIEIVTFESDDYLHEDYLGKLEKLLRLHKELHLEVENLDVIIHLLDKIESLQQTLNEVQKRLNIYE